MRYGKLPDGMHEIREDDEGAMILGFESDLEEMRKAKRKYVPVDEIKLPVLDGNKWQKKFAAQLDSATATNRSLVSLAETLGLKPETVKRLRPGLALEEDLKELAVWGKWTKSKAPKWMWTIPEYGADRKICGWSFRDPDGRKGGSKKEVSGATRGICVPKGFKEMHGPLYIVEGASDVGAMIEMGLPAFGRLSNVGGGSILKDLVPEDRRKDVVIVGENDKKANCKFPGLDGMIKIKRYLGIAWDRDVPGVMPPEGTEDCRTWLIENPGVPITFVPFTEDDPKEDPIAAAKSANERAFTNAIIEQDPENPSKIRAVGKHINRLVEEVHTRFLGFPKVISEKLFDYDRDSGQVRFLPNNYALTAWIDSKSGFNSSWETGKEIRGPNHLLQALKAQSDQCKAIYGYPTFPQRKDVFYIREDWPEPDPKASKFFEFCDFFCGASPEDNLMIRALFASALFYKPGETPGFIITAKGGQNSGKTTVVDMLAKLLEDPVCAVTHGKFSFTLSAIKTARGAEEMEGNLVSSVGMNNKIVLIDNCQGEIRSQQLSKCMTDYAITARPKYGHDETRRPNDLIFIFTGNAISGETDITDRCVLITLGRPENMNAIRAPWKTSLVKFLRENRDQILADIIGLISTPVPWLKDDQVLTTRFAAWERQVLAAVCGDEETYLKVARKLVVDRGSIDAELVEIDEIREQMKLTMGNLGIYAETKQCWWTNKAIKKLVKDVSDFNSGILKMKGWVNTPAFCELSTPHDKYPTGRGTRRHRGLMWTGLHFGERWGNDSDSWVERTEADMKSESPRIVSVSENGEFISLEDDGTVRPK